MHHNPPPSIMFDRIVVEKWIIFYRKLTSKPQKFLGRLRQPCFYFAHPNYGALNQSEVFNNWAPQALLLILCHSWFIFSAKINHLPHTDQYFLGRGRKNKKKYSYFFNVLFILFCGALNNLKWSEAIESSASAPQVIFWFLCSFWTIGSAKINHFLPKLTS